MLTLSETSSPQDVIINTCDPMQNPGQTWIFYKAGQTWLTQAKRDLVDSDDPDNPTQLQHWYIHDNSGHGNDNGKVNYVAN